MNINVSIEFLFLDMVGSITHLAVLTKYQILLMCGIQFFYAEPGMLWNRRYSKIRIFLNIQYQIYDLCAYLVCLCSAIFCKSVDYA